MIKYEIRTRQDDKGFDVPFVNDDGTVQVRITIDDREIDQNFFPDTLDADVKHAIAVIREELKNTPAEPTIKADGPVNVKVSDLPKIPPEDFQPETPEG